MTGGEGVTSTPRRGSVRGRIGQLSSRGAALVGSLSEGGGRHATELSPALTCLLARPW